MHQCITHVSCLQDYPSLLSQAVYAAFCTTFPDSYSQFNSEFKEDLVNLVFDWIAGELNLPRKCCSNLTYSRYF